MYDECATNDNNNKKLNCYYNGKAKKLQEKEGLDILFELCPYLHKGMSVILSGNWFHFEHRIFGSLKKDTNSLASGCFQRFSKKNALTHVALHGNFSGPACSTDPVKVSKDTASLLVCTQIFCLGDVGFCE